MTRVEALSELRVMVASIDITDMPAAAARLLERISQRVDALELRACLVELGAAALLENERPGGEGRAVQIHTRASGGPTHEQLCSHSSHKAR